MQGPGALWLLSGIRALPVHLVTPRAVCLWRPSRISAASRVFHAESLSCVQLLATPGSSVHGIFPGKNTGMDCHFLLQGIFLTQGSNPHLLHWQAGSLSLSHQGSPPEGLPGALTMRLHGFPHSRAQTWRSGDLCCSCYAACYSWASAPGEGNGNPLQYSCLENPMDRGAW